MLEMDKINPALKDQLSKLITSMGYELFGCELRTQGRQKLFRIYIDSKKGVTIDDCSAVSHQVSALMDVEEPITGRYALEVSSPGIDRPLLELEHFQKYIGYSIKVKLFSPVSKRKQYKGIIKRVVDTNIHLLVDNSTQEVVLPFSMIEKANLIGEVEFKNA